LERQLALFDRAQDLALVSCRTLLVDKTGAVVGEQPKFRGQPGSEVTIDVRRKGESKMLEFTITREVIKIKSVPFFGMVADGVGYVQLVTFSQDAGSEIERAVRAMMSEGEFKGLVLDLRANPEFFTGVERVSVLEHVWRGP